MSGLWPELVLVGVLVLLNAAFAGTEMALVSLRDGQLQRLEQRSATGALVARLARDPNNFLATIQVGITLAGFLASAAAAVSLAEPLEEPLGFLGGAARPVSIVVVTLALAYVTLVFGELAPKRVAMQRAERWALLAARPLSFVSTITRPVVWLLSRSTDLAVRLMGGDPSRATRGGHRGGAARAGRHPDHVHRQAAADHRRRLRDLRAHPRRGPAPAARRLRARRRPDRRARRCGRWPRAGTRGPRWCTTATSTTSSGVVHLRDLLDQGERPWASSPAS